MSYNMRKKIYITHAGLSVIELMIVAAVFTFMAGGLYRFLAQSNTHNRIVGAALSAQDEARKVLKPLIAEIRNARNSATGTYPIEAASDTSLTIYTNIDSDPQTERVRYFLDGTTLMKGVTQPSGDPLAYPLATEILAPVIHWIDNDTTPLFTYYDRNYSGTQAPMTSPMYIADIRLVKVYARINPLGSLAPSETIMTTQTNIRSLKDN